MMTDSVSLRSPVPPRVSRCRSLREIRHASDGQPFTLRELSEITGFSREKIRIDVEHGYLIASRSVIGVRPMYTVLFADGKAYLRLLGLLTQ